MNLTKRILEQSEHKKDKKTLKISEDFHKNYKEQTKKDNIFRNGMYINNSGFTLIELVMTILLTGIMAVGLYQVIMFGINNYVSNENSLYMSNSLSNASSVIRKNAEEAAMPPTTNQPPVPSAGAICPLASNSLNDISSNVNGFSGPIILACADGSVPAPSANSSQQTCTACLPGESSPCEPSEIAFYKYTPPTVIAGGSNEELIVFCINNDVLYKQVTTSNGTTTDYPVANNIGSINFQ
ncbi:MAG: prepilin-type N-terminal cleavage/methylation domain-containing protein [Candidatus Acididesulfobacter guangdongensis]|uniref:Prepilin-type N-terminal cleavage/methylation domain-containing protein n=1 Tax=Acididesulfobacter guangdongensis TaxID=2597225 RepID=A0A519BFC9_ACIG2|nr:MAG: prepilin-type N-terminal cleavage/methylation domain-containing protein [Candidatus Acididesulfobacter guangdongensis]